MPSVFALRWRLGLVVLGGAGLFAPAAEASSFVTIAPPKEKISSSFVVLGAEPPKPVEQAAATPSPKPRSALDAPPDYPWEPTPFRISASIIAFGTPAVEETKVASIGIPKPETKPAEPKTAELAPRPRPRPAALPKVIRGGVKGHAFPDYVAPQPTVAQATQPTTSVPSLLTDPPPDSPPGQPGQNSPAPPPAPRDPEPVATLE